MVGRAPRKVKMDRVSRNITCQVEIKNVGPISKAVGNTSRVLHQLMQVIKERKVVGLFTRLVSKER